MKNPLRRLLSFLFAEKKRTDNPEGMEPVIEEMPEPVDTEPEADPEPQSLPAASAQDVNVSHLVAMVAARLLAVAHDHLQLAIRPDRSFARQLVSSFDPAAGMDGLVMLIDQQIYRPLVYYRQEHPSEQEETAELFYDGGYCLRIGDTVHPLTPEVITQKEEAQ